MSTSVVPQPFQPGPRLIDGSDLNNSISSDIVSSTNGVVAFAGGGVTHAVPLTTVISRVTTVANANDSVRLPPALAGASAYVDNDGANTLAVFPSGTDTVEDSTSAISLVAGEDSTFVCPVGGKWYQTGTSGQFTGTFNGAVIATSLADPTPVAIGAAATLTAANAGATFLLNTAAGSVATLPAATGTGNRYKFVVSTTASSNSHKILAASTADFINGLAIGENAGTCKAFVSVAATNHSIQMPFTGTQPSGGFIGDYFEFQDIATNLWQVNGMYQAGTTPTTPFSSSAT